MTDLCLIDFSVIFTLEGLFLTSEQLYYGTTSTKIIFQILKC